MTLISASQINRYPDGHQWAGRPRSLVFRPHLPGEKNEDTESSWGTRRGGRDGAAAQRPHGDSLPLGRLRPRWAQAPGPRWCACASGSAGAPPPGWSAWCCCPTRRTRPWERRARETGEPVLIPGTWATVQRSPRALRPLTSQRCPAQRWQPAGR